MTTAGAGEGSDGGGERAEHTAPGVDQGRPASQANQPVTTVPVVLHGGPFDGRVVLAPVDDTGLPALTIAVDLPVGDSTLGDGHDDGGDAGQVALYRQQATIGPSGAVVSRYEHVGWAATPEPAPEPWEALLRGSRR